MSITITISGTASEVAADIAVLAGQLQTLPFGVTAVARHGFDPNAVHPAPCAHDMTGVNPSPYEAKRDAVTISNFDPEAPAEELSPATGAPIGDEKPAEQPKRGRGRPKKNAEPAPAADAPLAISADPENRVDPAAQTDDAETAAQDAADEAAEAEEKAPETKTLTHDDLRQAMGAYVKAFGMPAAQEDGSKIFEKALGPVPAGTENSKGYIVTSWVASAVPAEQESLDKAIKFWTAAVTENPFKRDRVG